MAEPSVKILYLDMNSYFASVEQHEDPSLRGKPVGIVTTMNDGAACIAASYEAKAFGIRVGTRMREARQMCPGISFRAARHDAYVHYHHLIMQAIEKVIPITAAHSVDEFSCMLSPKDQGLSQAMRIAEDARESIYTDVGRALRCSIGLGSSKLLAKIAGELKKPDGLDWLLPEVMPDKIAHWKLTDLPGISRRMNARLEAAGIHDIPALYAMSPHHARRVWRSVQGERFLRALHGEDIPDPVTKPHSLGHGQVLSPANRTASGARLVTRRLLLKAATRLRRGRYFATSIHISVKCAVNGRKAIGGRMSATQDSFRILSVFHEFWTQLQIEKPLNVSVVLGGLVDVRSHTADLFENRSSFGVMTDREKLCALVDGLNQRYGSDTIIYGESPVELTAYTGAKIAFGRVPTTEEFRD